MGYELPEDLRLLKTQTRRLVKEELDPLTDEVERRSAIPERAIERLRELGYFGITIPEEYGGLGLGTLAYSVILEELCQAHGCFAALISGNNGIGARAICLEGTEDQKRRFLPPLASGHSLCAFALTEPNAGSDAAAITTRAVRKGDSFFISGTKHFITRADIADLFTVFAVTDPKLGARGGVTAFAVERRSASQATAGLRIGRIQESITGDIIHQCEVIFEDCEVPVANVIGRVGWGFSTAMRVLDDGRLTLGAVCVGIASKLQELAVEYAQQRSTFGKPLASRQFIQGMIADSATEIFAARAMLYETAWKRDRGISVTREASMVKLFASEMVHRVADRTFQIFGGMAYMRECPIGRYWASTRVMRIVEGTSEIQRMIIARHELGG